MIGTLHGTLAGSRGSLPSRPGRIGTGVTGARLRGLARLLEVFGVLNRSVERKKNISAG
jgi:hypothetical protein